MALIETSMSVVPGTGPDAPPYCCAACGTTLEVLEDEDKHWLAWSDCGSDQVQLVEAD